MNFISRREVAQHLKVPEQTLRFYEKRGLIPLWSREGSDTYIANAKLIIAARAGGLNLQEVGRALLNLVT